jgi:RHS repeat-associated protein
MKTLRLFTFGLFAIATLTTHAQMVVTNGGTFPVGYYDLLVTNTSSDDGGDGGGYNPNGQIAPAPIAEAVTPDIQALADGLQDDPVQIFNYVHDHIRFEVYFGSHKGSTVTLLEKAGNDFDQSALLVALLRAAGYTNTGYQLGMMSFPFDNSDGSHRDIHHWFALNFTNNNWSTTYNYLSGLTVGFRGYPGGSIKDSGSSTVSLLHMWVTLTNNGTAYYLDPSFKVSEPISGISLATAMGSTPSAISNTLMTAAAGADVGSITGNFYTTNLNETAIRTTLAGFTTNFVSYLANNYPNASVEQIASGQYIVPATNTTLSQSLLFSQVNPNGGPLATNFTYIPTNFMSTLYVSFSGTSYRWLMPALQGHRLALVYGSSTAQLWQDDTSIASGSFSGSDSVTMIGNHPFFCNWYSASNVYVPSGGYTANFTTTYNANSYYAMLYSFDPDWGWLKERQNQLQAYRQQGLGDSSRQVITETLNIMGLNYSLQTEYMARMLGKEIGVLPLNFQKVGRMGQVSGSGYFVDIYGNVTAAVNNIGLNVDFSTDYNMVKWDDMDAFFGSAMEHGMIEQLQSTGLVAASTIKMCQLANANHEAIYLANSNNWSSVQTQLTHYTISDLTGVINAGCTLLLPQNGSVAVNGSGSWTGYGFMAHQTSLIRMLIGAGIYGGYSSDLGAVVSPTYVDYSGYTQPSYFNSAPVSVPSMTGADPVNMADGTFQAEATDLALGETEPRGLSFSRYYNSSRRNSNLAGMAPGWLHNYYINLATNSAPQPVLGGTTPAQAAGMLVATAAATYLYNCTPDPKNWMVTFLITKWGIDQITAKAVSVSLGKDTIQFIQQPDGTFTPPANCTMTLTQNNGAFVLQERHGRAYQFNGGSWCTNIVDQYNQALSLTYGTSNWVSQVKDWKGRTLTFAYSSSAPIRLQTVTDSTGRKVSLGYSSRNDLNSVVDPEGSTNTFAYDTNHQITATFNAMGQMVASNIYNSFGRVTTQYTGGSTNRAWHIFWSGWKTISQDPAGASETYFYDDKTRTIGQSDTLGNLTQKFYDGQDHVVMAVTPLGETNQFIFDGDHNLLATIDPLGYSNQFFYDGQNNLTQALDASQNATTYGYNAQFSMIGQTNGMSDWVSLVYNTDGNLYSRSDIGGTTTLGYDSYGQVNSVTYPGSLGGESMVNNAYGDATNHVNARGFATAFQFNNRRQLTNTIAPTNVMVKIKLDAVGNVAATTDARGNVTSNVWSVTQHLLKTTLPALSQGTPSVTNIYDNRDLLVQTIDALTNSMLCTNDMVGRTVSVTDPLKLTTRFTFDADGHVLSTANAGNETNSQIWDARGKKVQTTDGGGHSSQRVYDGVGNVVTLTNRNQNPWQFKYDAANRLTKTTSPLGKSSSVTYNHQGLPNYVTDPMQQPTSLYYDAMGRLTNRTDNVGTTLYALDANGNVTNVVENSLTNSWTYDAYNRVSSYTDVYGNLIQYRFDANGNLTNLIYPGNRTVTYTFDSHNHLTNVTDWSGRNTSIGYNLAGHVTSITRPNGSLRTMGYDPAGQMTNIMEQMSNGLPIAIFRFGWTNTANMAWEFAAPQPHATTVPTRTMTYDADNRLKTVDGNNAVMDDDGNLTSGPLTNDTLVSYVYDARNRLTSAGGVTNTYDSSGNRIALNYGTNQTLFVVNPNAALPEVLMRIKNGVTNYYIYGPGLLYQITETATRTNTLTYHYDYRGSTIAISADSSLVTDRIEYAAYGLPTYRVGTNDTPFLFNGRYGVMSDPNGLLAMNARYYNPFLCRFISSDPSGFNGGLNWYAFANGNPVGFVDPFGLGALSESTVDLSWFAAPTPAQQEMQNALASFVNFATMGVADLAAKAFQGTDIYGNQVPPEDQNEAAIYLTAMLIPGLGIEGLADDLAVETAESFSENISRTATQETATQLEFPFVSDLSGKPPIQWPANDGFAGNSASATLVPGTTIDRYGLPGGTFVSPTGTPFIQRSLAPGTQYAPYNIYTVLKPIQVQAGEIAPAFGMPGGGVQFKLPSSVQSLIDSGHLGIGK